MGKRNVRANNFHGALCNGGEKSASYIVTVVMEQRFSRRSLVSVFWLPRMLPCERLVHAMTEMSVAICNCFSPFLLKGPVLRRSTTSAGSLQAAVDN